MRNCIFFLLEFYLLFVGLNYIYTNNLKYCNLKIKFETNEKSYAGIYYPLVDTIIIQLRYRFTPFTYYKVIAHEIIHALGFEHIKWTNDTVMTPSIKPKFTNILSAVDVNMIRIATLS